MSALADIQKWVSAPVDEPEDQRNDSECRDQEGKCDIGYCRIGEARQHADSDHWQRVARKATNKIARYDSGTLIRGSNLVHLLQTAAIAETGGHGNDHGRH